MSRLIRIAAAFCIVLLGAGTLSSAEEPAKAPAPEGLKVVVKLSKTKLKPGEEFTASFRVENTTKQPQIVWVMSCSFWDHWKADKPQIFVIALIACKKNLPEDVEIAPGEAYARDLPLKIAQEAPAGKLSFHLDFKPINGQKTFSSDELTVEIAP